MRNILKVFRRNLKVFFALVLVVQLFLFTFFKTVDHPVYNREDIIKSTTSKKTQVGSLKTTEVKSATEESNWHRNDLFLNSEQNLIFNQYKPSLPSHQERLVIAGEVRSNLRQAQYTILEYTYIGGGVRFCNMSFPGNKKEGHKEFHFLDTCAYTNCRFTCNKSLASSADAFLTHLTDVESELNQHSAARDAFFSNLN